jgi:putative spermidine/putrescine transport system permease protein
MRAHTARSRGESAVGEKLLAAPLFLLVLGLVLWPLGRLLADSFRPSSGILGTGAGAGHWTLDNYREIWRDHEYRKALLHSIEMSLGVATAATLLCLAPAWLLVRRSFRGKRLVRALLTLPMSFSGIIIGFLAIIMVGRIGVVPQLTEKLFGRPWLSGLSYSVWGLALAYLYFEIPRATLTLEAALKKFDFTLEAAARTLGAGPWHRLGRVLLPLMAPALVSTFAVTFSVSLGSFGVALIVSKRYSLLSLEIFQLYTGLLNAELAAAMAVVLIGIAVAVHLGTRLVFGSQVGRRA